ncbi:MAG: DUF4276 family protein [Candidatus Sumerlaeota bacterium]|nr:DUF4276 family protein [Candidatus Sumerlaeota bacterium]
MKVGFIVECGPQGAETKVIPFLARALAPKIEPDVVPLDKKPILKQKCGKWAKALLDGGCRRVLIVWDMLPDWGEYEGKGCQHDDREEIATSLKNAGLNPEDRRIRLICIHKMLEAWIIADERALSEFLSTGAHAAAVKRYKKPESIPDPKSALTNLFRRSGRRIRRYVDRDHAIKIVQKLPDLGRLNDLSTFKRFRDKLTQF